MCKYLTSVPIIIWYLPEIIWKIAFDTQMPKSFLLALAGNSVSFQFNEFF